MLVVYDSDRPVAHAQAAPTWAETHKFWITLMGIYAADCARVGVDNITPADELRYERSYVSGFMSDLIRARSSQERERIICEATQFLEAREQKTRRDSPAMKVVNPKARPALR